MDGPVSSDQFKLSVAPISISFVAIEKNPPFQIDIF